MDEGVNFIFILIKVGMPRRGEVVRGELWHGIKQTQNPGLLPRRVKLNRRSSGRPPSLLPFWAQFYPTFHFLPLPAPFLRDNFHPLLSDQRRISCGFWHNHLDKYGKKKVEIRAWL